MSLYSSLTQVLAPFAAKINGLLTGWDGTVYSTPGEAVREQINDLHVLIGDEPGTAIQASAVAYGNSDVGTELTNVNGRLYKTVAIDGTDITWAQGTIGATGIVGNSNYMIRSDYILSLYSTVLYQGLTENDNHNGYVAYVCQYTSDKTFISRDQLLTAEGEKTTITLNDECKYMRFLLGHPTSSGVVITPSDGDAFGVGCSALSSEILFTEFERFKQSAIDADEAITEILYKTVVIDGTDITWKQGTIGATGIVGNSNYMIRSDRVSSPYNTVLYQGLTENDNHDGYVAYVCQYTSDKTFISRDQLLTAEGEKTTITLNDECKYMRFLLGHPTSSEVTITPSEKDAFAVECVAPSSEILFAEFERFKQSAIAVENKVDLPTGDYSRYGETGQILSTLADGRTKWINMAMPSQETITKIVEDWLDDHPQAVTNESNRAYSNVAEMMSDSNISLGMICETLGFFSIGDGGGAYYQIVSTGVSNSMDVIALNNGLYAILVMSHIINVKQLGAYGDATHDDSAVLLRAIELLNDGDTLYFPTGTYLHGDGVSDTNGTGNSYVPTGTGNGYYHDAEHPVDIGRDIRLIIDGLNNINIIGCGNGSTILSNPNNGECRNNEIFSIINCDHVTIKNIVINGNRQERGLYLSDSDYGGYNHRGNLRIIGCDNVIIDNLTSINSGMDGLYLGISNVDSVKRKSQNCRILNSDFSNAHRNGISVGGCSFVYIDRCVTDYAGVSGETWGGTNPKSCVDIEADYGENYPNEQIFIDGMKAFGAGGNYSMYISSHSHNVYIEHCAVDKNVYTSSNDTSNINTDLILIE